MQETLSLVRLLTLIAPVLAWGAAVPLHADESLEPPLIVDVEIESAMTSLAVGSSGTINVGGKSLPVKITPQPHRTLKVKGATFAYPMHFAFEYDNDNAPLDIWTLDGNDVVITLQRFPANLGDLLPVIVQGMVQQFGETHSKVTDLEITLAGKKRAGKRIDVSLLDGIPMVQQVYGWQTGDQRFVMVLQDTLDDAGKSSKEFNDMSELLKKSFAD